MLKELRGRPVYWLLPALPLAIGMEMSHAGAGVPLFAISCLAIVPLAALMGRATESLAEKIGQGLGGLLNATFGNAAELIIALVALVKGPANYPLVKASLTGSIVGNVLLVLGLSIACGGVRYERQTFNRTAATLGATLLVLASIGLILPTLYYYVFTSGELPNGVEIEKIETLSVEIAALLAFVYVLSLVFMLRTHSHLYSSVSAEVPDDDSHADGAWSMRLALAVLIAATVGIAVMSEVLVGSVGPACEALGMSTVFVGVIVVAIIGNAAEHSTAVLMAMKNKMDLAVNIAIGSSIQIALFVAPVLVFASLFTGHVPLDLHFTPMETIAVALSVAILSMVSVDGETHWLEGAMLLAVYAMLALAFYHLPEAEAALP